MADDLDALEKSKLRLLKKELARKQAEEQERREQARIRSLEKALANRQAMLLGETIRDATLSEEERSVIARVLSRRSDKVKDWSKISKWTGKQTDASTAEPVEFVPTRPQVAVGG